MALQHGRRRWVKLWVSEWLDGTIRFELTAEQRGLWADLIALAGGSRHAGVICQGETNGKLMGYPIDYLSSNLRVKEETLRATLEMFKKQDRISVSETGAIYITNWKKYQSEYQRQAQYRRNQAPESGPAPIELGSLSELSTGALEMAPADGRASTPPDFFRKPRR